MGADLVGFLGALRGPWGFVLALATVLLLAPWWFILTFRLVPRSALMLARTDRDRALELVEKVTERQDVQSERLGSIEKSLSVVEHFFRTLPTSGQQVAEPEPLKPWRERGRAS